MQPATSTLAGVSVWFTYTTPKEQYKLVIVPHKSNSDTQLSAFFVLQHQDPPFPYNILLSLSQVVICSAEWLANVNQESQT